MLAIALIVIIILLITIRDAIVRQHNWLIGRDKEICRWLNIHIRRGGE